MTTPAVAPASLVVADRSTLFASALALAVDRPDTPLTVVQRARSVEEALAAVEAQRPDVVLLDIDLDAHRRALSVPTRLSETHPDTPVLVLVPEGQREDMLAILESGAVGFATRGCGLDELVETLRAASRGEACVPRNMLGGLLRELVSRRRDTHAVHERYLRLSPRERQVFAMLGRGMDHLLIAEELVISPQTARTHIQRVLKKMDVHSRVEAAAVAVEHGYDEATGDCHHG